MKFYKYKLCSELSDVNSDFIGYISSNLKFIDKGYRTNESTYVMDYIFDKNKIACIFTYGANSPTGCYETSIEELNYDILSDNRVHLTKQVLLIIKDGFLYSSDDSKKNIIFNTLKKYNIDLKIKALAEIDTIDEFIDRCKRTKKIKIKAVDSFFVTDFIKEQWFEDNDLEKSDLKETYIEWDFDTILPNSTLRKLYRKLSSETYISEFKIEGEGNGEFMSISNEAIISRKELNINKNKEIGYYEIEEFYKKI